MDSCIWRNLCVPLGRLAKSGCPLWKWKNLGIPPKSLHPSHNVFWMIPHKDNKPVIDIGKHAKLTESCNHDTSTVKLNLELIKKGSVSSCNSLETNWNGSCLAINLPKINWWMFSNLPTDNYAVHNLFYSMYKRYTWYILMILHKKKVAMLVLLVLSSLCQIHFDWLSRIDNFYDSG